MLSGEGVLSPAFIIMDLLSPKGLDACVISSLEFYLMQYHPSMSYWKGWSTTQQQFYSKAYPMPSVKSGNL